MEYYKAEVKSGCFVILALLILVSMLMWLGSGTRTVKADTTTYVAKFTNVGQIRNYSPVYMYGKVVGRIQDTRIRDRAAEVVIAINADIKVYENARFVAKQINLLGQLFVFIEPGTPVAKLISREPDETEDLKIWKRKKRMNIPGVIGSSLVVVMENAQKMSNHLNDIFKNISENQEELWLTMIELAKQYAGLGKRLNQSYDDNKKKIDLTVGHLEAITLELRKFIMSNRKNIDELIIETKETLKVSRNQLERNGENLQKLLISLQKQIDTGVDSLLKNLTKLTGDLDETIIGSQRSIFDTLRNVKEVSKNLKVLTAKLSADPSILIFGSGDEPSEYRSRAKNAREFRDKGRMPAFGPRK